MLRARAQEAAAPTLTRSSAGERARTCRSLKKKCWQPTVKMDTVKKKEEEAQAEASNTEERKAGEATAEEPKADELNAEAPQAVVVDMPFERLRHAGDHLIASRIPPGRFNRRWKRWARKR